MPLFPDEGAYIRDLLHRLPKLASSKKQITVDEAEALLAADDDLFSAVAIYTSQNPDIFEEWPHEREKLIKILTRIKPFIPYFKAFYRGEPDSDNPDADAVKRGFRSWSINRDTAEYFARDYRNGIVRVRTGPVKGVEIQGIATWRMRMTTESHYGGMQAEWLLLDPGVR